jgi:hypothetical protein
MARYEVGVRCVALRSYGASHRMINQQEHHGADHGNHELLRGNPAFPFLLLAGLADSDFTSP